MEPTAVNYRALWKEKVPLDDLPFRVNFRGKPYQPATVEESLEYIASTDFQKLYRGKPVWFYHRRNFKGHFPPKYPRKSCLHGRRLLTSNPCPICRDEFLVLDYQNVELLKHFLHPSSADILEPNVTGLCKYQHEKLLFEIEKARDVGSIEIRLPFLLFDYAEYYGEEACSELGSHLVSASGSGGQLEPQHNVYRDAAEAIARLPPSLADLMRRSALVSHVEEVAAEPPAEIERPSLPNRYHMEENYRKLLLKRRRAKSILLEGNTS